MPYENQLINEKSPYLLQHAHNPVHWYPWGNEAFKDAKDQDKPIFLSIGYSACHWCHVMERESFEDEGVANLLNQHFISIKVDREERADIDQVYMNACVALTGQGGWPLNLFLTPDKKPFFAGTYFPKEDSLGMRGLKSLLVTLHQLWQDHRQELERTSQQLLAFMEKQREIKNDVALSPAYAHDAFKQLSTSFDPVYGGFSPAPKFPSAHILTFLMRYGLLNHSEQAMHMVDHTLTCMAKGGIFDHIGGGFCRYATDAKWLVPHFEKMTYDNAMLIIAYSEAGAAIDPRHFDTANKIIDYMFRDMLHPDGGFYTAQDADSEGVEGKYYVFTPQEIHAVLGQESGNKFCRLFNITPAGNFEGKNIPNFIGQNLSEEDTRFNTACFTPLLKKRSLRTPPFLDDKIITSSNGLMIAALSTAGRFMQRPTYIQAATKTAQFILENLYKDQRLYAGYKTGTASHLATSDDYAYVCWGLFTLYQATFNPIWLSHVIRLCDEMLLLFADQQSGLLFLSGHDVTDLPARSHNIHDGALPSGNAIAAQVLFQLSTITHEERYEKAASNILSSLASDVSSYPSAYTSLLTAQLMVDKGLTGIVIADPNDQLSPIMQKFYPFTVLLKCGKGYEQLKEICPYTKDIHTEKFAAYVCRQGTCHAPITNVEKLKPMLS